MKYCVVSCAYCNILVDTLTVYDIPPSYMYILLYHTISGKPARSAGLTEPEKEAIKSLMLLTLKPVIYAANVPDTQLATGNKDMI